MNDDSKRRESRKTWPGRVVRDGWGDAPRYATAEEGILAVFALAGWLGDTGPRMERGASMVGRVIRASAA